MIFGFVQFVCLENCQFVSFNFSNKLSRGLIFCHFLTIRDYFQNQKSIFIAVPLFTSYKLRTVIATFPRIETNRSAIDNTLSLQFDRFVFFSYTHFQAGYVYNTSYRYVCILCACTRYVFIEKIIYHTQRLIDSKRYLFENHSRRSRFRLQSVE